MRKLCSLVLLLVFTNILYAMDLEEGVHYEVISDVQTSTPEIKEFFSFYCSHCYAFEPLAKSITARSAKEDVKFVKSHVNFLRGASADTQHMLTKALVVSKSLQNDKISDAIFDYIHKSRAGFSDLKDVKNLFLIQGVSGDKFDKLYNSFSVKAEANKMKKAQETLVSSGALKGVPTFIVNGKYKIVNSGFKAKSYDEWFTKIENAAFELAKKK